MIQSGRRLRVYGRGRWYSGTRERRVDKRVRSDSVEAVKVAFEDALAHGGRGATRAAFSDAESRRTTRLRIPFTAERERALRGAHGGVGWRVGW